MLILNYFSAYGLRDANAYVLVYDLLCPDSFDYISGLFSQVSSTAFPSYLAEISCRRFHQHFTGSFCARGVQKRKKTVKLSVNLTVFFAL